MPAASSLFTPSVGRTFLVSISLLGVIALAQLGTMSWVFIHRLRALHAQPRSDSPLPGSPLQLAVQEPVATGNEPLFSGEDPFPDPLTGTASRSATGPIPPPAKPEPVSLEKLNPAPAPPENRFQELLQQGRLFRERGDTNTALIRFREASLLDPSNAETIAQIAITYEKMGLADKAAENWRRIFDLGPDAGTLYIAAESKLKMSQAQAVASAQLSSGTAGPANDAGPVSTLRADATLGIGEIAREERPETSSLLKFALQIPLKAKRGARVDVRDVDIHVLFYDQLDPKTVVQTGADVSYKFTSTPVDWANGEAETLEVQYNQPAQLGKGPKQEERKYYGYVVRVYYKDELQDTRAEPESLHAKFPAPQMLDRSTTPK